MKWSGSHADDLTLVTFQQGRCSGGIITDDKVQVLLTQKEALPDTLPKFSWTASGFPQGSACRKPFLRLKNNQT